MALSQRSTIGPRMKCWASITSAIAASISDLIERYCALRSSNGTFISGVLFVLSVRPGAGTERGGQRRFLVEVETPKNARFRLPVAVAAFGAAHHSGGVGRLEPVSVAAHPADPTSRIAHDQREVRHASGDHRSGGD